MKKNTITISAVLGLMSGATVPLNANAQAAANGLYVGVGAGESQAINYCDTLANPCKPKGTAYKFFAGWQFHRNVSVEVGYTDLGHATQSIPATADETTKAALGEVTLVGSWPGTDRFSLFGKFGGYYGRTTDTVTIAGVDQTAKKSNGNVTYGAGVQYFFTSSLAVRGEGQRYVKVGGEPIGRHDWTAYTVGLLFKF